MRAYRIVDWEQPPRIVDVPEPTPDPGQAIVRVAANGLCHSDALLSQTPEEFGRMLGWQVPFTLGHEIAGTVAAVGAGVDRDLIGASVAVVSPASCGRCRACRRGAENACVASDVGRGFGADGGLAPLVVVGSVRELVRLDGLDPVAAAPLTDAGATSLHAVRRALSLVSSPPEFAVVVGAGGLGSFAVQFLRVLTDAEVVAVDPSPRRRGIARDLGAQHTVDGVDADTPARLAEVTGGAGAGVVLDFVGVDATIRCGVTATGRGGAFGLIGASGGTLRGPWYGALPRDGAVFSFQGSDIADLRDALELATAGQITSPVERFAFDDVAEAYARLERGELDGRAVVIPDRGRGSGRGHRPLGAPESRAGVARTGAG